MIIEKMQLLAYQTADSTDLLRVLYVNPEMGIASLIPLKPRKIVPKIYDLLELELRFQEGEISFVEEDPFEFRFWPDELFCEAHKLKRDETWALFSFHLQNHNGALYNPRRSKSYRRKMSEELCVKRVVVDRVVTRFLQGGEVPNALIPLYQNCGVNSDPSKSSKRGPQNAYEEILDLPKPSSLADDVVNQMLYCIEHYYLKEPKNSLNDAYNAFLEIYFESLANDGMNLEEPEVINEIPTLRQFRHLYETTTDLTERTKLRKGHHQFNLKFRGLLSDSMNGVIGPLSRVETDSKILRIRLVNQINRSKIIGDPILYLVVDVFSRAIIGVHIGINNASWKEASKSLVNMVSWEQLCEEYGIEYHPDLFPHDKMLPKAIVADRGEYEGPIANSLVNSYGIELISTPPYRPDLKGPGEIYLNVIQIRVVDKLYGAYKKRHRGEKAPEGEASVTLPELICIVLKYVKWRNNEFWMTNYPLTDDMRRDGVRPIPNEIFKWGLENISGAPNTELADSFRLNLLPRGEASVTSGGILFEQALYVCETAIKEQWFSKARIRGRWRITVSFDPNKPQVIYWRKGGNEVEPCIMNTDKAINQPFLNASLYEAKAERKRLLEEKKKTLPQRAKSEIDINNEINALAKSSKKIADEAKKGISTHKLKQNIRENRNEERRLIENDEQFEANEKEVPAADTAESSESVKNGWYIPEPSHVDKLKQIREKAQSDNPNKVNDQPHKHSDEGKNDSQK